MIVYEPENARKGKHTYLIVAAHHDDVEFMGAGGIVSALDDPDGQVVAVVVSDGRGSARTGEYADTTDEEMMEIRIKEQEAASEIGRYSRVYFLGHQSSEIKDRKNADIDRELKEILEKEQPYMVFTHSPFDKHPTHLGTFGHLLQASLELEKPLSVQVIGCEVWRDLDWLDDRDKIRFDISRHEAMLSSQLRVYHSQIEGGKRYDLATIGRWRANATYGDPHAIDEASLITTGIDMSSVFSKRETLEAFAKRNINRFLDDVEQSLL